MLTNSKRLLQCILNYLSNAVKFTETGIGISKDDLPNIFKAFERLESRLKIHAGGPGLYLTKKLATELLSGTM